VSTRVRPRRSRESSNLSSMRHTDVRFDNVDELICHHDSALQLKQREYGSL
jgi:uncharacterized protein (DUF305 family)